MRRTVLLLICFGGLATMAPAQQMPIPYGPPVLLEQARRVVDSAKHAADQRGFSMAFAVVEPSGQLVLFEKMDGTQYGSEVTAQEKARTAARFKRPTKAFSDAVAAGRVSVLSLPGAVAIEGGVPIVIQGRIVGALGVSGGTSEQDGEIAAIGLSRVEK
jgi:glc operon protein GlcG